MKIGGFDNSKIIFHIDMDSFFASCIQTIKPELKNKPIAVATNNLRAIISAASYEAKKLGIKVGIPVHQAKETYPDLIIVEPDFKLFNKLSTSIFDYIAAHYDAPMMIYSIDECWLDATNLINKKFDPIAIAKMIQNDILEIFDISLSIGIGHNLWVAKMSTDINKPFGITWTKTHEFKTQFYNLPIKDFFGVGRALTPKFNSIGINTIGDFCEFKILPFQILENLYGARARDFLIICQGKSSNEVIETNNALKGIGNSKTFDVDLITYDEIRQGLFLVCDRAWTRLKNRSLIFRRLSVALRFTDRSWKSQQQQFKIPIRTRDQAFDEAVKILDNLWNEEIIRGLGVHFSDFESKYGYFDTQDIFDKKYGQKDIYKLIRDVNRSLEKKSVFSAREKVDNQLLNRKRQRFIIDDFDYKKED